MTGNAAISHHLNIIPCIHSLLYAPIYLAILCMQRYAGGKWEGDNKCIIKNTSDFSTSCKGLQINILPAANGDIETIANIDEITEQQTKSNGPGVKHINLGICDPREVYNKNFSLKKEDPDKWLPAYKILGVFVDKIILSIITRIPGACDEVDRQRNREYVLSEIIKTIESDALNSIGILSEKDQYNVILYEYWSKGVTTEYLVKRYLQRPNQGMSGINSEKNAESPDPRDAVAKLLTARADIVITHAPWEIPPDDMRKAAIPAPRSIDAKSGS